MADVYGLSPETAARVRDLIRGNGIAPSLNNRTPNDLRMAIVRCGEVAGREPSVYHSAKILIVPGLSDFEETDAEPVYLSALQRWSLSAGREYIAFRFGAHEETPLYWVDTIEPAASGSGSGGSGDGDGDGDGNRVLIGYTQADTQCIGGRLKVYKQAVYQYTDGTVQLGDAVFDHDAGCCHCGSGSNIIDIPCCSGREVPATLYLTFQTQNEASEYVTRGSGELFWDGEKWTTGDSPILTDCGEGNYLHAEFYYDPGGLGTCTTEQCEFSGKIYEYAGGVLVGEHEFSFCTDAPNCVIEMEIFSIGEGACGGGSVRFFLGE